MKYLDDRAVVDVGTVALASVGAAGVAQHSSDNGGGGEDDKLAQLFTGIAAFFCLTNLFGIHRLVRAHWEQGFGDKFFPWPTFDNDHKRVLAGSVELIALFLTQLRNNTTNATTTSQQLSVAQCTGYAMFLTMYGRGALVHAQLSHDNKSAFMGLCAALAGWLLFRV